MAAEEARPGTVLVLGGGWTGTRLCARLPRILGEGLRMVTTARTAEKVEACERLGFHTVRFELCDKETWLNLPPPAEVILTIITFALDGSSVEAYGDLWSNKLNQDAPVFCLGTSSAFGADKELNPAEPTVVSETSPLTGLGVRGNSLSARSEGESWALARGAAVLHLSDCARRKRGRRAGHGAPRFVGEFARKDYRNGLKLINLIHIADIALIISFLYEKWTELQGALRGRRLLVTSGAYLSQDLVRLCGLDPIPEKPFPDPSMAGSKFVRNSQLCNLMPDGFAFTPPMPGLQPQPCPPSEGRS